MFVSIGSVIIDDIVLPDGTTHMGCLGGGSVHAVMGMRVWSEQVGLVGNIGYDFPPDLMDKIVETFDARGLIQQDNKTIRAWQLFEWDGKRTEIFRTDYEEFLKLEPDIDDFPDVYDDLTGIHLLCPIKDVAPWVQFVQQRGNPFVLWEPWAMECTEENRTEIGDILPMVDCVSPNLEEAQMLLGQQATDDLLDEFLASGARMAVIRKGAEGSSYADQEGNRIQVPAVKVKKIVDQTGAGNAYCGGFIVGMTQSTDPCEALCKAAVSASFPLEQFGALFPIKDIKEIANRRYQACMEQMAGQ